MLAGVVASFPFIAQPGGGSGIAPNVGMGAGEALVNFYDGIYLVEGVTYTAEDLFEDAPMGFGFFTPARIIPGTGYVSDRNSPDVGAVAKGPLLDLLMQPHCIWAEVDALGAPGAMFLYVNNTYDSATSKVDVGSSAWEVNGPTVSAYFNPAGNPFTDTGINRIGCNVGVAEGNFAINGQMAGSDQDLSLFFEVGGGGYYNEVPMPLGGFDYEDAADGNIRWIAIKPPLADTAELATLTTV